MPKYFKEGTIPDVGNMYFLYGGKGVGKTTMARRFPGLKLLFSFDGSTNAIAGSRDVRVIAYDQHDAATIQSQFTNDFINSVYVTDETGNKVVNPELGSIVLDNVTALMNWAIDNIENGSKDGRQNWNLIQKWFRDLGFELRATGLPILAVAHEVEGANMGLFKPDMNDKTFNAFASVFDVSGRLYKKDGQFRIDMDPETGNKGANRLDDRKDILAEELLIKDTTQEENKEN